uniref:Glucose-methanol-choline oxidoreductase N-terminal domain-containing protein n=1 Tax=Romanomermis culicivorax TaxID=13658 RepID=A0A915HE56_ROMCU
MNMMFYVRGHPDDFDHWSRLGNDLWSYDQVLPYFKMSETIEVDRLKNSHFHGHDGPLHVTEIQPTKLGNLRSA